MKYKLLYTEMCSRGKSANQHCLQTTIIYMICIHYNNYETATIGMNNPTELK